MRLSKSVRQGWWLTLLAAACFSSGDTGVAQNPSPSQGATPGQAYQMAERSVPVPDRPGAGPTAGSPNEHPLAPAIRWAYQGLEQIDNIQDYSATVVKRERIDGKLGKHEYLFAKIRQKPFSVYLYFLDPPSVQGQEVIFIEGQNDGKILAHGTGLQKALGTVKLDPTGYFAMRGQRYPITELGLANLLRRLIEVGEKDSQYGECDVKYIQGAKINNRVCTCIQVTHPVPRSNFLFHIARIFVDDELNLPVRYESYDWPTAPGAQPELMEEYTYLNLKLNNGFTDADFDTRNPNYQFKAN